MINYTRLIVGRVERLLRAHEMGVKVESQPGRRELTAHLSSIIHLTVQIGNPALLRCIPKVLADEVNQLWAAGNRKFQVGYGSSVFHGEVDATGSLKLTVFATANKLLPNVFGEGFGQISLARLGVVTLYASTLQPVKAQTGWYAGNIFGFPLAGCMMDPHGILTKPPTIYCVGKVPRGSEGSSVQLYANVIGLFEAVMGGSLTPTRQRAPK